MGMKINVGIRARLIIAVSLFLLILMAVTAGLVVGGLRESNRDAVAQSRAAILQQRRTSIEGAASREAQINDTRFQQVVAVAQSTIASMQNTAEAAGLSFDAAQQLQRQPAGYFADPRPGRVSDTFLPRGSALSDQVLRDGRDSASLDSLFPTILRYNADVVAAYFIGSSEFSRYYPPINLGEAIGADNIPSSMPFYTIAAPKNNPERTTVWTEPYTDPAGQGQLITASTPIYDGATFRGVFCVDVSLQRLVSRLEALKPTPGSHAFLINSSGHLIAATVSGLPSILPQGLSSPQDLTNTLSFTSALNADLTQNSNPQLQEVLAQMRAGRQGVAQLTLAEQDVLLGYAAVPSVGWSLAVVSPVQEITAPADELAASLRTNSGGLTRSVLLTMGVFTLLALASTLLVGFQITRPLTKLAEGARAVAAGRWDTRIDIPWRGEFSELADAFNTMTGELGRAQAQLEQQNSELERTVAERTAALSARTGELQHSLEAQQQLNATIAALSVPILPVREDSIVVPLIGALDPARAEQLLGTILDAVQQRRSRTVVLDVTGMAMIDTATAQMIIQTASAVGLLGAEIVLVGIRPELAQTLVALGVQLGHLRTAATLQEGMAMIERSSGKT
jgi:anti-anti-sigma factor